jgi:pimeloyl-ACP methyl ester carboxylesterase
MLALRHRVVSFDLWGFGASARLAHLVPALWTTQVLNLMDALAISAATLVGHSIGGRVAINCAATAPERVRGLALLASDGAQFLTRYPFLWAMARTPLLRVMIYRLAHSREEVARLLRASYADGQSITDEMVNRYQRPLRVQGTYATLMHLRGAYPGGDLTAMLRRVECPTTILWGNKDRVAPVHSAFEMLAALPATELLIIPNIGHLPQEECPERVAEHLERFLERLG